MLSFVSFSFCFILGGVADREVIIYRDYDCGATFASFCGPRRNVRDDGGDGGDSDPRRNEHGETAVESRSSYVEPYYVFQQPLSASATLPTIVSPSSPSSSSSASSTMVCEDQSEPGGKMQPERSAVLITAALVGGVLLVGVLLWVVKRWLCRPVSLLPPPLGELPLECGYAIRGGSGKHGGGRRQWWYDRGGDFGDQQRKNRARRASRISWAFRDIIVKQPSSGETVQLEKKENKKQRHGAEKNARREDTLPTTRGTERTVEAQWEKWYELFTTGEHWWGNDSHHPSDDTGFEWGNDYFDIFWQLHNDKYTQSSSSILDQELTRPAPVSTERLINLHLTIASAGIRLFKSPLDLENQSNITCSSPVSQNRSWCLSPIPTRLSQFPNLDQNLLQVRHNHRTISCSMISPLTFASPDRPISFGPVSSEDITPGNLGA